MSNRVEAESQFYMTWCRFVPNKNPVLKNIMCWHLVIFTELNFPVKYEFPEWEFMNQKDFDLDNESFLKKIERTLDTVKSNNLNSHSLHILLFILSYRCARNCEQSLCEAIIVIVNNQSL